MSVTDPLISAMLAGVPFGTEVREWRISPDLEEDLLASRHEFGASTTGFVPERMLFGRPYKVDLPRGASPRFQIIAETATPIGRAIQRLQAAGMSVELSDVAGLICVDDKELTYNQVLSMAGQV